VPSTAVIGQASSVVERPILSGHYVNFIGKLLIKFYVGINPQRVLKLKTNTWLSFKCQTIKFLTQNFDPE